MREHLELAAWGRPAGGGFSLGEIEAALLVELKPPLNLKASSLRGRRR